MTDLSPEVMRGWKGCPRHPGMLSPEGDQCLVCDGVRAAVEAERDWILAQVTFISRKVHVEDVEISADWLLTELDELAAAIRARGESDD